MSKSTATAVPFSAVAEEHEEPRFEFTSRERLQASRLLMVLALTASFFGVEFVGALWADSDVLRAEALHLLTDVAALGMSFLAMRIAVRRPTARFTYGLRRAEPVAAIFNALLVLGATTVIVIEAASNLSGSAGPVADRMLYVAAASVVVNGIAAWLIHGAIGGHGHAHHHHDYGRRDHGDHHAHASEPRAHHHEPPCEDLSHRHLVQARSHGHSLNLRGAWLHLFGDALGALAALVAAICIKWGVSAKADPIASFVVAAILVFGAIRLLRDAVLILLEASPTHLPVTEVRAAILGTSGAAELHDLHVWTLGAGHEAITAHVGAASADITLAARIEATLRRRFHVEYVTIQIESGGVTCQAEDVGDDSESLKLPRSI
ncbi:MAG TPA: cation diffusion facilitator family transporter [Polyangiaceae bacterium]|nr:cation diffusion facilitator family transporter [Polyangiaceae bacterium]